MTSEAELDAHLWAVRSYLHRAIDAHAEKVHRELRAMTERNRRSIGQLTRIRRKK